MVTLEDLNIKWLTPSMKFQNMFTQWHPSYLLMGKICQLVLFRSLYIKSKMTTIRVIVSGVSVSSFIVVGLVPQRGKNKFEPCPQNKIISGTFYGFFSKFLRSTPVIFTGRSFPRDIIY